MLGLGNAATYGLGWTVKQVTIRELVEGKRMALCVDTEGQRIEVTTVIQRTGIELEEGQQWLIDRTFGHWSFAAYLDLPT